MTDKEIVKLMDMKHKTILNLNKELYDKRDYILVLEQKVEDLKNTILKLEHENSKLNRTIDNLYDIMMEGELDEQRNNY